MDVAMISKQRLYGARKGKIVTFRKVLLEQNVLFLAVPSAGPAFVGPVDAKGNIYRGIGQQGFERALQYAAAGEPVMMKTEAMNAVLLGERGLLRQHLRSRGVIEAEASRQPRLIMAHKTRNRLCDIGPFGEAGAPPLVVFR